MLCSNNFPVGTIKSHFVTIEKSTGANYECTAAQFSSVYAEMNGFSFTGIDTGEIFADNKDSTIFAESSRGLLSKAEFNYSDA